MVNGAPHPNLGNICSPRHEDHPEVWRHWARSVAKTLPMGIVLAADGFPHQRHIHGFCRLTPLMRNPHPSKTRSDDENHHQHMGSQMLMMLIALPMEYASFIAKHGIVIANSFSWEPIVLLLWTMQPFCWPKLASQSTMSATPHTSLWRGVKPWGHSPMTTYKSDCD